MSKESKKQCVALSESTPNKQRSTDGPAFHQVQYSSAEEWMRKLLLYATAKKVVSGQGSAKNADQLCPRTQQNVGMHTHTATLPYLVVTIISIQSPFCPWCWSHVPLPTSLV